ncbi:hypothetical protein D3880_01365 [Pseudomonas cavernae]|uniref:Uncharacterized protein n=1 Tax=Pseudomonas cavernae TaxID=2320867 RepID=A0A385YWQ1_9PSED|nr:hypothetical protein [Pseudomonas cavernae]AYC31116.1 hypothetical protein D3880_01365 [Pseudomonas cavernae]
MSPQLRSFRWLIYAGVLLVSAWSLWTLRGQQPGEPLPWLVDWQQQVFVPLAEERLTLAELRALTGGELWVQPQGEGGPRLLYRADWRAAEQSWQLEAELALSQNERDSLLAATGLAAGSAEQALSGELLDQLGQHRLASLLLKPADTVAGARLIASLGQPRVRLGLQEGGEAWVYPQLGLTLFLRDEQLQLLQNLPRRKPQNR